MFIDHRITMYNTFFTFHFFKFTHPFSIFSDEGFKILVQRRLVPIALYWCKSRSYGVLIKVTGRIGSWEWRAKSGTRAILICPIVLV